jgi:ABC-type sugar transport system substrate-binding protein
MLRFRIVILAAALAASLAVAATTSASPAAPHGFKLGFSFGLENLPIYPDLLRPVKAEAKAKNVQLLTGSADSKCDQQIKDLHNFVQAGVDAIVFNGICGSGKAYDKFINEAKAKNIRLVSYSAQLPNVDGSISWNDKQGAEIMAADAKAWINRHFKAPYTDFSWALLACSFAPPSIALRTSISNALITKLTGKKPYNTIDCAIDPDKGKKAVDTYLQKDSGLDMVIAVTDDGAYGAALSFKQHGIKTAYSAGVNGSRPVIKLIAAGGDGGLMSFSSALDFARVGHAIVDVPYNIINGTGPSSVYLNYAGISVTRPAQAKAWYQRVFLATGK